MAYDEKITNENLWSFGQVLPLMLLSLPLWTIVSTFFGMSSKHVRLLRLLGLTKPQTNTTNDNEGRNFPLRSYPRQMREAILMTTLLLRRKQSAILICRVAPGFPSL